MTIMTQVGEPQKKDMLMFFVVVVVVVVVVLFCFLLYANKLTEWPKNKCVDEHLGPANLRNANISVC